MRGKKMDLNTLDTSSQMIPMLVRLHDSHKLYSLAHDKKPEAQAELSSAVEELIGVYNSPREEELIADVLIALMRQAEKDLKFAMAERIARMDGAPLRLVLHIANEEIDVARSILQFSATLSDLDLVYLIKSKGIEYSRIIAKRERLSGDVVGVLADTRDNETIFKLLENMNIVLPPQALRVVVDMAQDNDDLAQPLLLRKEITNELAAKLYVHVGQEIKRRIVEMYEIPTSILLSTLDEVVLEFRTITESEFTPTRSMIAAAVRHKEKGLLTVNMMLSNLRRGLVQSFIAEFSVFLDVPAAVVEELLSQPKGNGVAIMCRSVDIQRQDFMTIFLLTNRLRQQERMVDVSDMSRAVGYFNKITPNAAAEILSSLAQQSIEQTD